MLLHRRPIPIVLSVCRVVYCGSSSSLNPSWRMDEDGSATNTLVRVPLDAGFLEPNSSTLDDPSHWPARLGVVFDLFHPCFLWFISRHLPLGGGGRLRQ